MNHGGYKLVCNKKPRNICFYCGNPITAREHFELTKDNVKSQIYLCQDCYQYLSTNREE